ncbi:sugar ABC transporter ATP-binding protein [Kroppenstedtia eburnea]|uniref:Monosaccharide ABC transporter ATP-binding protein, CUT2 family n=1 Tax=Kroppenstedtia eburnea TaxID=714067 RepID=A0A1N7MG79_9BACL|nr:sugar ABC transporter ATP-binding protein [Kroppenstedtia eburnea]QKI81551.1 sugar ABC transporter ATP-binding protein [Kroppenstedtia eburnea]SIS85042.1 monosaccharide ABC transporter ATP-binding protein, CUT2 family [Kroppenstedtia eburnea]
MTTDYIVQMNHISKHFGGVTALDDVKLNVVRGEIHALIGENGAGKSTLMKILAGAYPKDEGTIIIDGKEATTATPRAMIDMGVSVIYQEFMLAPDLTVAENIFIDNMNESGLFVNWKGLKKRAKEQLEKIGFGYIDPGKKVGELSVAYQQIVEICKCLAKDSKVLVFDEPTAALTHSETEKLLNLIRKLKEDGVTILYISHRLEELFAISDRITVLKDGKYVDTVGTSSITKEQLVTMMVGRKIEHLFPERHAEIGEEILRVQNLSTADLVKNVSFSLRRGEVLGFSGLVGSGRTETMRAIFGADRKTSGKIGYFGKEVDIKNPKQAIKLGIGLLPEDRKTQGLLLKQPIRINTTLVSRQGNGFINHRKEKAEVKSLLAQIATKYGSTEDNADSLSGGNQQKVALAKWLAIDMKLIILDEPTRGVDVGAKTEIYRIINELAERGIGVIIISSEMEELIGTCDRVIVMREGRITGEVAKENLTENNLIKLAMGV